MDILYNYGFNVLNIVVFVTDLNVGGVGFFAIIATLNSKP